MARTNEAERIVRAFWQLMASNDFNSVMEVLALDFVLEWPQSMERIRGAQNFAKMNSDYPTSGRWSFTINKLVADNIEVVTQVSVTDGSQSAEPISFFTVKDGKITKLVEYWPDPFVAQANKSHLVEQML